jgi:class 3 adenylate cyclase/tetratricopeptide (TPR) repeat protein
VTSSEIPLSQRVTLSSAITVGAARAQMTKVMESPPFKRSPRMQALLTFLIEETLNGRGPQLKEYVIAVEVFGKPSDFDPSTSAVVRVEVGRLRRLLAEYEAHHAAGDALRLVIPKGRYVPSFEALPGVSLVESLESPESQWQTPAERRLVTALSCALTLLPDQNSTHDFITAFGTLHSLCADIAHYVGGTLDGTSSDRLVLYFNWPQPMEDSARHALTAALRLTSDAPKILRPAGYGIQVGIATGEAALRAEPGPAPTSPEIIGAAPAMATRLLSFAPLNSVLVADSTRQLAGASFDFVAVQTDFANETDANPAWRLLRARPEITRFQASHLLRSELVGRREELDLLVSRGRLATEGEGQAVLVTGEPGMGKSRLMEALIAQIGDEAKVFRLQCAPHHRGGALSPFLDFVRSQVGGPANGEASELPIAHFLSGLGLTAQLDVDLLWDFLGSGFGMSASSLTPSRQKDLTLDLLKRLIFTQAGPDLLLLLVEDLHWADPTTLELLHLILENTPETKTLLLMTSRPDPVTASLKETVITTVRLSRLSKFQAMSLVDAMPAANALSMAARKNILDRAEGTPLFLEELTRIALAGSAATEEPALTDRIIDVLAGQLARLGSSRAIAQVASVVGIDFTSELLSSVMGETAEVLERNLDRLMAAELVVRRSDGGSNNRYLFRHALLRDAAYASLLPSARRQLHGSVAEAIVEHFPELAMQHPERVAMHYMEAGQHGNAIPFWFDAGQKAAESYALNEAASCFRRVLQSLATLPSTFERRHLELSTLVRLGAVVRGARGYADSELAAIYGGACELARDLERPLALAEATYGLWTYAAGRGDWPLAQREAEQFQALIGAVADNSGLMVEASRLLGSVAVFQGRFDNALVHFKAALSTYKENVHGPKFGFDPGAAIHAYLAWTYWHLGDRQKSRKSAKQALHIADMRQHPPTTAMVLSWLLILKMHDHDHEGGRDLSRKLIAICAERECRYWQSFGLAVIDWADFQRAPSDERLTRFLAHAADFHEAYFDTYLRLLAAEMAHALGNSLVALELLGEAGALMHQYGEQIWLAEFHRIKAKINDQSGDAQLP